MTLTITTDILFNGFYNPFTERTYPNFDEYFLNCHQVFLYQGKNKYFEHFTAAIENDMFFWN